MSQSKSSEVVYKLGTLTTRFGSLAYVSQSVVGKRYSIAEIQRDDAKLPDFVCGGVGVASRRAESDSAAHSQHTSSALLQPKNLQTP